MTANDVSPPPPAPEAAVSSDPYRRPADGARDGAVWAAVANVVVDTSFIAAEAKRGGRGTRHFAPGAKVYIARIFYGPGGEYAEVIGRHRGSKTYVRIVIRTRCLENARVKIVHSPRVRELLGYDVDEMIDSGDSKAAAVRDAGAVNVMAASRKESEAQRGRTTGSVL